MTAATCEWRIWQSFRQLLPPESFAKARKLGSKIGRPFDVSSPSSHGPLAQTANTMRSSRETGKTNAMKRRAIVGLLAILWAEPGNAADAPQETNDLTPTARELSNQGLRQYQLGDYGAAIESFLGAFALSDNAGLLFNVAQAYRLQRDCRHAGEYYRRYLDAVSETA